ncbi:hypothetical protein RirG_186840 [Rhizophagus irregularis DAOM 197198w]|uniref:SAP domain-containing protein n=1 Tax=Rhizophagus irregularis (strain DAOM 197198w) TaxID=1432141 RepID=A0A015LYH0_RHIIW|nr:hypothetical protein RirG_186840 [Rhizophagus irregularis DAOM 197198w]
MSITPDSLRNKRKNELKEIALDLGLSTKGLRSDLEERIRIHLENASNDKTSESTSSKTPRRSFRKKSISTIRVKSRRDNIPSSPNGGRSSSDEENQSVSSENESKQDIIITQTTSELETTETVNLRGLPSDNVFKVNTFLIQLRKNISNSTTFCKAVTCLELLVFLYCAIEWSLKIASIPIPNLGSEESYNYDFTLTTGVFIYLQFRATSQFIQSSNFLCCPICNFHGLCF